MLFIGHISPTTFPVSGIIIVNDMWRKTMLMRIVPIFFRTSFFFCLRNMMVLFHRVIRIVIIMIMRVVWLRRSIGREPFRLRRRWRSIRGKPFRNRWSRGNIRRYPLWNRRRSICWRRPVGMSVYSIISLRDTLCISRVVGPKVRLITR